MYDTRQRISREIYERKRFSNTFTIQNVSNLSTSKSISLNSKIFAFNTKTSSNIFEHKKKKNKKIRLNFRTVFVILCLIGLLTQGIILINDYLKFETNVSINLKKKQFTEFPGMTICVPYFQHFNRTEARNMTVIELYRISRNLTSDPSFSCTISPQSIINNSGIHEDIVDCSSVRPVIISTNTGWYDKCFTFFSQINLDSYDKRIYNAFSLDSEIVIKFKNDIRSMKIDFRIHPSFMVPSYVLSDLIEIEEERWYKLYFTKTMIESLKYPYETDCSDYGSATKMKYPSQAECFQKCLTKQRSQICGCLPQLLHDRYLIDELSPDDKFCCFFLDTDYEACRRAQECTSRNSSKLFDYCTKICPKGCVEESYTYHLSSVKSSYNDSYILQILHSKFVNDIHIKHSPSIGLPVLIANLGGVFGFWLGFSILNLYDWLIRSLVFVFNRMKTTSK